MSNPHDFTAVINAAVGGWNRCMGLSFTLATADEVSAELTVGPEHLQPYGIIHGGVYAGIIETVCSTGAALAAARNGQVVVGVDNHSTFLRATRAGRLRVSATPVTRGRRTQVWDGRVLDDEGRVVASGRVRLLCLEGGSELAGENVEVRR
ncbi:MAG: PaaI family thioesterase [Myxococcales bacterium]|nr:PaaI family thioesterase [Myxococcales bacterium]